MNVPPCTGQRCCTAPLDTRGVSFRTTTFCKHRAQKCIEYNFLLSKEIHMKQLIVLSLAIVAEELV